jgi:hypothetical protein
VPLRNDRYNSFFRQLLWLGLAAGGALASACGGAGGASIEVVIHAPPPVDSTGHCPADAPVTPLPRTADGPTTLRLTYRRTGGPLVCDAVIALDAPRRLVGVPHGSETLPALDIVVEAFRGDVASGAILVGSGLASGVDLGAGGEVKVLVTPRDRFACAPRQLAQGRAFHTATTLADGRVLLVGGLVPDPADASKTQIRLDQPLTTGGFYASRAVELYDPDSGAFTSVDAPELTPRAFHAAYALPGGAGEAPRVLLVGGLAPAGAASAAPVADGVRDAAEPLRLVPTSAAVAAPAEILTLGADGSATVTRLSGAAAFAPRLFAAATRAPSPGDDDFAAAPMPLVAGGYTTYPSDFAGSFEGVDLTTPSRLGGGSWTLVPPGRVGATVTWIGPDRALVWGGSLGSALGSETADSGDLLEGFAGVPTSTKVTYDATTLTPAARAFHAAVALGTDDLLIVGGFSVLGGAAGEPAAPFAERVGFPAGDSVAHVEAVTAADAVAVGYLDATPLPGGDALVSGGSPALGTDAAPCPDGTANFGLCAVGDAWRWNAAAGQLDATTPLIAARWGHRSTVLLDGSVLVTGGFTNVGQTLFVVRTAELYNPRTEARDAAADALGAGATRLPGDVARGLDGLPIAPCEVVELK